MSDTWRYPNERRELVERLIRAETERDALHRLVRDLTSGDDTPASLLVAKEKQLMAAERNIEVLSRKKGKAA